MAQPDLFPGVPDVGGPRNPFDAYDTPPWCTLVLLDYMGRRIAGVVWEPCAGLGLMANVLESHPSIDRVVRSDVQPRHSGCLQHNFLRSPYTDVVGIRPDWSVSNPPFVCTEPGLESTADEFCLRGIDTSRVGCAMLVRLSFLEPVSDPDRGSFLKANPPTDIIYIPRPKFLGGGKGSDQQTCVWLVWQRGKRNIGLAFYSAEDCVRFGRKLGRD